MTPPFLTAQNLSGVPHGFFGRAGGVSVAPFDSLNTGPGSGDDLSAVEENQQRCARALGAERVITGYQTHSAVAAYVSASTQERPSADALVTDAPGLAIGVLAADCVPVLFDAGNLVGAAHAGWRGSLGGILEATIALLEERGAERDHIRCAIGPALRAPAFEVGPDLVEAFTSKFPAAERFFEDAEAPGKSIFDHIGFVRWRLEVAGVSAARIEDVGGCTLSAPDRWFSYRASQQGGEDGFGRNLSAICLPAT